MNQIMMKKAQLDYPIITFFIVIFGLLLLAPIILKVFYSIKTPISSQLGNISNGGQIAQANFNTVINTAINFWDKVIIAAFFLALILLVISAIFIDTSPFFVIIYIFLSFMLILFAPNIVGSLDAIYGSQTFAQEVSNLSFMDALRNHFAVFLVGIIVFTGIIIYGKIALFGNQGGNRR
jgi:hypothetical protein